MYNILAIDVEDWYHPEYVKNVVKNKIEYISSSFNTALNLIKDTGSDATFFLVGEIAEKHPEILEQIQENENEIAFHGYYHDPLWNMDIDKFRDEVKKYDALVYSVTKEKSIGFRAPSYSLDKRTSWALEVLEEQKYVYDASVFPMKTPLYGVSGAPTIPYHPSKNIIEQDTNRRIIEFPALIYNILGIKIPVAGGFYLRFLPLKIIENAIKQKNKMGFPAIISVHPWELDDNTPKLKLNSFKSFATYYNINTTKKKIKNLLSRYKFVSFKNYIENFSFM